MIRTPCLNLSNVPLAGHSSVHLRTSHTSHTSHLLENRLPFEAVARVSGVDELERVRDIGDCIGGGDQDGDAKSVHVAWVG